MASFTLAQLDPRAGTGPGLPYSGRASAYVIERTVDFSKARPDGTALALAENETGDVLPIPAKCVVLCAGFEVITPEGGTQLFSLGDSSPAATQYGSSLNANAAAGTVTVSAASTQKAYTSASALRVTATGTGNVLNVAVIRFFAIVVDLK